MVHTATVGFDERLNTFAHGSKVYGDVWCVGNQLPSLVEYGAGEIETFLDIDRIGCVLKCIPHLFGDRHKQLVKYFQQHRVDPGSYCGPANKGCRAREDEMI